MWKQFYETVKQILFLTIQTQQNREEIKELRLQVRELASALERLAYEVHRIGEKVDYAAREESHEREKLALRL
jgi:outer membrane murein-binding lipoprotein Lpp